MALIAQAPEMAATIKRLEGRIQELEEAIEKALPMLCESCRGDHFDHKSSRLLRAALPKNSPYRKQALEGK
jgi:hypothetical protein